MMAASNAVVFTRASVASARMSALLVVLSAVVLQSRSLAVEAEDEVRLSVKAAEDAQSDDDAAPLLGSMLMNS